MPTRGQRLSQSGQSGNILQTPRSRLKTEVVTTQANMLRAHHFQCSLDISNHRVDIDVSHLDQA